MKTIFAFKEDFKKSIFSFGFLAAIIFTFLLCFTDIAYEDRDTGKIYTLFEALITFDRDFINSHSSFSWQNISSVVGGTYFMMFMPIIAAFPFIPTFCAERNSGLIRLVQHRTGKIRYCISKFFTCLASGGLAVTIGYVLFFITVFLLFPSQSFYLKNNIDIENIAMSISNTTYLTREITRLFLFSAASTIPAFFFSSFIRNRYVIVCLPFMLSYMYNTFILMVQSNAKDQIAFGIKWGFIFPDALTRIFISDNKLLILSFYGILIAIVLTVFTLVVNFRFDSAE